MTDLHFSQGFSESRRREYIIILEESMRFRRIAKERRIEELTEYKKVQKEYKKSKQKSTLFITLLNTLFNTLFITLLGLRRKEYA